MIFIHCLKIISLKFLFIFQFLCSPLDLPLKSPSNNDSTRSRQATTPTITIKASPPRSKTQISSVYTKLSSIKPTATSNNNNTTNNNININGTNKSNLNSSIPTTAKPMKSTKIEHPKVSPMRIQQSSANIIRGNDIKVSPYNKRTIPQLVKSSAVNGVGNKHTSQKVHQKPLSTSRSHLDDSNGNSATSSLSTSSSNSSLNAVVLKQKGNDVEFLTNQLNEIYSRGLIE